MRVLWESVKKAFLGTILKGLFGDVTHFAHLAKASHIHDLETRRRTALEQGDEYTARYLEQCLAEAAADDAAQASLDYVAALEAHEPTTSAQGGAFLSVAHDPQPSTQRRRSAKSNPSDPA